VSSYDHRPALRENSQQSPWLVVGLGVKFTRGTQELAGWILKVYADTAHVVPDTARVGDQSGICVLKGSETRAWECSKRGDDVFVFDGPRRSSRGTVIGFDKNLVFVKTQAGEQGKSLLIGARSPVVQVQKKDLARYSQAWVDCSLGKLTAIPRSPSLSVSARSQGSRANRSWWDDNYNWEGEDEQTPREGAFSVDSTDWGMTVDSSRGGTTVETSRTGQTSTITPTSKVDGSTPGSTTPLLPVSDSRNGETLTSETPLEASGLKSQDTSFSSKEQQTPKDSCDEETVRDTHHR